MRGRTGDLLACVAASIFALVVTLAGVESVLLRTLAAAPLLFVLPGYALVAVLFPASPFRLTERVTLIVGSSLTLAIVGALLLNATPLGLRPLSWAAFLSGLTISGCLVAFIRRRKTPVLQREPATVIHFDGNQAALFGFAAAAVVLALVLARADAANPPTPGFTRLWMLPAEAGQSGEVRIGVHNREGASMSYTLRLTQADSAIREWQSISLAPGETWETTLVLPPVVRADAPVEATLYRAGEPDAAYRRVNIWLEPAQE